MAFLNQNRCFGVEKSILYLVVWVMELVVTHQTSWLKAQVYVVCNKSNLVGVLSEQEPNHLLVLLFIPASLVRCPWATLLWLHCMQAWCHGLAAGRNMVTLQRDDID